MQHLTQRVSQNMNLFTLSLNLKDVESWIKLSTLEDVWCDAKVILLHRECKILGKMKVHKIK